MKVLRLILNCAFSFIFLLVFPGSECQEQSRSRALYWLQSTYAQKAYLTRKIIKNIDELFSFALYVETGIRNRDDVVNTSSKSILSRRSLRAFLAPGDVDNGSSNRIKLLQSALMYKGYYNGPISGRFDAQTSYAVTAFKRDALGDYIITNAKITPVLFFAIVEAGQYKQTLDGNYIIRRIQQYLNRNYGKQCAIIPTNGKYSIRTYFNLVRALQIEVGCEKIDKRFGEKTAAACPTLHLGDKSPLVTIVQIALHANGESVNIDGIFGNDTAEAIKRFQQTMCLDRTGVADRRTICALLSSCGDISRPALACDCWKQLSYAESYALYRAGYKYVGRYLTGNIKGFKGKLVPKYLSLEELKNISRAGLRLFLIFQESAGHDIKNFNDIQGIKDAKKALNALKSLKIPHGAVVYFSVDCDPFESQVKLRLIPYFREVYRILKPAGYNVGIYGPRLACSGVLDAGYASLCFVNDATPLYHGNLAQKMPKNWAFDQFCELSGKEVKKLIGGNFRLDKVAVSGKDPGVIWKNK